MYKVEDQAPELYLDWEERLVKRAFGWWRKLRPKEPPIDTARVANLVEQEEKLRVIAQLFAGNRLHVRASEATGGIRGKILLLPPHIGIDPDKKVNEEIYVLRAVIEGTRIHLGVAASTQNQLLDEVQALAEAAEAIAWLKNDFCGFKARFAMVKDRILAIRQKADLSPQASALESLRLQVLCGQKLENPAAEARKLEQLANKGQQSAPIPLWGGALNSSDNDIATTIEAEEDSAIKVAQIKTEIEAAPKDHVERVVLKLDGDEEVAPMHTFEKVDFLAPFNGRNSRVDGSDELEDHQDALDEVDLRHITRGGDPAESVFRTELDGLSTIPDVQHIAPGEKGLFYDEWFQNEKRYKKNWVTVYPSEAETGNGEWAKERLVELAPLRRRLLRRLEGERWARRWIGRQTDGDEIDLDALMESYGDRKAGHSNTFRLYRRNPRRRRDNATTVLIDISLSSDSWVDNQRVLDVSRDAVLLFGEVADALGDTFEVLAFASNTRNHCRVWRVKGWQESWRIGQARLALLSPTGYTRMGPALRHASARLQRQSAERKLLLLITDGKPNDYDRYEGAHGIADVRQACREASKEGIVVHAIGIDPSAAHVLPTMFGVNKSQLLKSLQELPEALVVAYAQAT